MGAVGSGDRGGGGHGVLPQPFTRSGGPVEVDDATEVVVRAHMNNARYGGNAFVGSIASEFAADPSVDASLAPELADAPPQPTGCAY